jgi:hypothetical protein
MSAVPSSRWDSEVRLLAWLAVCVSVFSFLFYFRRGDVLLYGDAVAHINIARRVFDSKTPGLLQLGTVWLPLPHLLMIPFLISNEMWIRGVGGSIPSMVAYVLGVVGIFRLMRGVLSRGAELDAAARIAAWTAAVVYGANPNLIYMQTTAMGEAVYLAFFIWAVVFFSEFVSGDGKALTKCGWCIAAAGLTRYDGWFLAAGMVVGVVVVNSPPFDRLRAGFLAKDARNGAPGFLGRASRVAFVKFVLLAAAAPLLWLAYNSVIYRNPLEFANGPYSARAIEQKTGTINPAKGNLYAASMYFLKSAEENLAEHEWLQRLWVLLAIAGAVAFAAGNSHPRKEREDGAPAFSVARSLWSLFFLWVPLPFYALSVAYGSVPIFVPAWWPFSQYNLRYGLELLPAFAASLAVLVHVALRSDLGRVVWRRAAVSALAIVVIASYATVWVAQPICYREAAINAKGRMILEKQVANWLKALPPNATLLMYLGAHPAAVEQASIPLRRVINEGNHRVWMQPSDPEGLWERALANPPAFADYAVAFEGDPVWQSVQGRHWKELVEVKTTGEPRAIVYQTR